MTARKVSRKLVVGDGDELTFRQVMDVLSASARAHGALCRVTIEIEPLAPDGGKGGMPAAKNPRPRVLLANFPGGAVAAAAGPQGSTVGRVINIVESYNRVQNPTGGTILGPAVPAMQTFVGDVNAQFGKNYITSNFKSNWDINRASVYIDTH